MTSDEDPHEAEDAAEPQDGSDAATVELAAHDDERFLDAARSGRAARLRFTALLVLVLLLHAAIITAFLWRDQHDTTQVAQIAETPVEIVQEPPPEPPKPPPPPAPKQPPPQKPKEDLSPALSAPRAPNEEKVETKKLEAKTSAPKAPIPPTEGQQTPKPQAPPPKDEAPPSPAKEDEASKEEDKTKPDAEALEKAKPKVSKQPKPKEAKAAPKRDRKTNDLLASLSGTSLSPEISFARPTPKSRVYGGTEDVRWMSEVEGMLEDKVGKLPRTAHWQDGGHVVLFFHVDVSGRVISKDIIVKSGYPDIDAIALRALAAAAPFPPPPPGIEHGLVWSSVFDGQLPTVHVSKR